MSIYRVSLQRSRCRTDNHISANGQTEPLTWPYTIAITIPIAISHSHSHHIHCRYHTNNSPFFVVSCDKSATSHTWHLTTVFMATLPPPMPPSSTFTTNSLCARVHVPYALQGGEESPYNILTATVVASKVRKSRCCHGRQSRRTKDTVYCAPTPTKRSHTSSTATVPE